MRPENRSGRETRMKILVIEDDKNIVETLCIALGIRWPDAAIITTGLGQDGIRIIQEEAPDAVVLDIGLPDISGFDVLKKIRSFSNVPVIILTLRREEADIIRGLELGADDYQVKPFRPMELLSRIQAQVRRVNPALAEKPLRCGSIQFSPLNRKIIFKDREIHLTSTESIIVNELIRNAGSAVTYSRLCEVIWGVEYPDSIDGLRVYIRRIREKIEDDPNNPKVILTTTGEGYSIKTPV